MQPRTDPSPILATPQPLTSRRSIATLAFRTGACRFIPAPFVDDVLISKMRRRYFRNLLNQRRVKIGPGALRALTSLDQASLGQRLRGLVRGLIVKPFRKMFRTVFFWFSIRDAGRTATESYLLGHMVARHLARPGGDLTRAEAKRAAAAFSKAVAGSGRELAGHAWRRIWNRMDHSPAGGIAVEAAIELESPDFLTKFDERFVEALGQLDDSQDA